MIIEMLKLLTRCFFLASQEPLEKTEINAIYVVLTIGPVSLFITLPYYTILDLSDELPQQGRPSKRLQIEGLLHKSYATKDIVQIVKTTPGNVWKVKSILKRKSELKPQEQGPNSTDDTILSAARPLSSQLAGANANPIILGTSKETNDSLISKEVKDQDRRSMDYSKLYSRFLEGERPIDIILNYNFTPSVVEEEYARFQRLTDLKRGWDAIMLNILSRSNQSKRAYEDYKKDGYMTLSKVAELVKFRLAEEDNTNSSHLAQWRIIRCKQCNRIQKALVNPQSRIGINISSTVDIERCDACSL